MNKNILNEILIEWDNSDNDLNIAGPIQDLEISEYPPCLTFTTFEKNRQKIWNILINDWNPLVNKCGLRNYLSNNFFGDMNLKSIFTGWDFNQVDGLEEDVFYLFQEFGGDAFADLDTDDEIKEIIEKKINNYLELFKKDKKWKFCSNVEKNKDWIYCFYYKTPIENDEYLYLMINTKHKERLNTYCTATLFVKDCEI